MALISVDCCLTDFLLEESNNFSQLSFMKKKKVVDLGRSTPSMKIDFKRKDGFVSHFNVSLYQKYTWLSGSCKLNKMFCFPCLLFSNSPSVWSRAGYADINNLVNSAKKHVKTEKHIRSCLSLHEFGINRIETSLGNSFTAHNKKVEKNRKLMERFIDTVVLLGKQEQAFRGHEEKSDSNNRGNYIETVLYLSKYDTLMDTHLEQCSSIQNPIFSGLSSDIQNDLIHSIATVLKLEIKVQVSKARFVSIMIDETPDVSHREQLSAVLRYLSEEGIEERFLGFFDVSGCRNADQLTKHILDILDIFSCKDKLIGQSYDGAAVMSGEVGGVKKKVLDACPMANFIPCYAHVLNLVLSRSLENISELKVFFGSINTIVRFFNKSTKRSNLLKQIANRRMPGVSETRWHYHSRIINVILNCRLDIIETFNRIIDNPDEWDNDSLSTAESLLIKLEAKDFCFFLNTLSEIFAKTDILFNLVQNKQTDVEFAKREIESFESWLSSDFLNKFESIFEKLNDCAEPPRKRRLLEIDQKTHYKRLFVEIKDNIISQINTRYKTFTNLIFLDLLNKSKYDNFALSNPDEKISSLINFFPGIFDFTALKNELKVLYTTSSLRHFDVLALHKHLKNEILRDTFPQIFNLSSLFLTLPITVASVERSFSALKRIHTYLRNSQGENRLSDLALISIEKQLLLNIKSRPDFYERVLAEFTKKDRRIALEYK